MNNKKTLSLVLILSVKTLLEEPCLGQSKISELDTICIQTNRVRLLYKKELLYELEKQKAVISEVEIATLKDTIKDKNHSIFQKNQTIALQTKNLSLTKDDLQLTKQHLSSSKKTLVYIYILAGTLFTILLTHFVGSFSIPNLLISLFKKTL